MTEKRKNDLLSIFENPYSEIVNEYLFYMSWILDWSPVLNDELENNLFVSCLEIFIKSYDAHNRVCYYVNPRIMLLLQDSLLLSCKIIKNNNESSSCSSMKLNSIKLLNASCFLFLQFYFAFIYLITIIIG